jgi:hypothetical protein
VARFAESHGFEHDYDRPYAYHYRDFVIKALNADMPYDQFVRWQLAGDEFEPDNPLALMATGFLGAGVFPTQITANEVERTRYDALDDMLSTTGTAMLGLTVGCARCHDHKYDPVTTHDYYRMLSTFTTTVRSDIELDLNPEVYPREKRKFDAEHAPLLAALKSYEDRELPERFAQWLSAGAPLPPQTRWELLEFVDLKSKAGATFKKLDDGSYLVEGKNADFDRYTLMAQIKVSGVTALRLEALAHESMVKAGPGRADNGNIGLSRIRVWAGPLDGSGPTNEIKLVKARASFEQNTNNLAVASALDEDQKTGWAVDPQFGTNHVAVFEAEQSFGFAGGTALTVELEFDLNKKHNIGRPRLALTTASAPELDGVMMPGHVADILRKLNRRNNADLRLPTSQGRERTTTIRSAHEPEQVRSPGFSRSGAPEPPEGGTTNRHQSPVSDIGLPADERTALLNWWKTTEPGWQKLNDPVQAHLKLEPKPKLTKVMVCAEGYKPMRHHTQGADFFNETHFLHRGNPDQKRGPAAPGFLPVLMRGHESEARWQWQPPEGVKYSGRRRAFANWITDTEQGAGHLLARVIVNRLWQHHFGQGLVATPNDFGAQGAKPTHPELLDWLATELIRQDWRLKPLHRLLLTSSVYLQDTSSDPVKLQADPGNQLFARRAPRRLEAEVMRDAMLAVSGALDPTMFGPGTLDEGHSRRSIYFMIKRSRLAPALQLFDLPEPLVNQGARPTTTIAPQALHFMNNAHVRRLAAQFARRLAPDAKQSLEQAVTRAYELALSRRPIPPETRDAIAFIRQQAESYRSEKPSDTRALALTDFCQVMMSLNEFVYVE